MVSEYPTVQLNRCMLAAPAHRAGGVRSLVVARAVEYIVGRALRLGRCVNQRFAIIAKLFQ
jgi:hypothetical protein